MTDRREPATSSPEPHPARKGRRRYRAPTLVEYGPLGKLTRNNPSGSFADGGGQRMMMACL